MDPKDLYNVIFSKISRIYFATEVNESINLKPECRLPNYLQRCNLKCYSCHKTINTIYIYLCYLWYLLRYIDIISNSSITKQMPYLHSRQIAYLFDIIIFVAILIIRNGQTKRRIKIV